MFPNQAHLKSHTNHWATPSDFRQGLEEEFGPFTFDPCPFQYEGLWSGLTEQWVGRIFINPPYEKRVIGHWMRKAWESAQAGALVVALIPSRTDTIWWHAYVMKATEIRFIKGRLHFNDAVDPAPFPSALVIWQPKE